MNFQDLRMDYQTGIEPTNGLGVVERMELVRSIEGNIRKNAVWICDKYKAWSELDDCIQEGTLRAWRLSGMYRHIKEVPFRGFAMKYVKFAMAHWILYHGRVVHIPTTASDVFERIWADAVIGEDGETVLSELPQIETAASDCLSDKEREALEFHLNTLSEMEKRVLDVFVSNGLKPKEIASRLSISYQTARTSLENAMKKMRRTNFKPQKKKSSSRDGFGLLDLAPGQSVIIPIDGSSDPLHHSVKYYAKTLGWEMTCKRKRGEAFATVTRYA